MLEHREHSLLIHRYSLAKIAKVNVKVSETNSPYAVFATRSMIEAISDSSSTVVERKRDEREIDGG